MVHPQERQHVLLQEQGGGYTGRPCAAPGGRLVGHSEGDKMADLVRVTGIRWHLVRVTGVRWQTLSVRDKMADLVRVTGRDKMADLVRVTGRDKMADLVRVAGLRWQALSG